MHFLEQMNEKGEINLKKLVGNEMIPVYLNNIAKNPKDADSHFELGFIYNELENYEQAEKYMSNVVSINPDSHAAWGNLGVLYASHFQDNDKAKECFEKALFIHPNYEYAIYNLACLYSVQKNRGEALTYLHKAITLNPDEWKIKAKNAIYFEWLWEDVDFLALVQT